MARYASQLWCVRARGAISVTNVALRTARSAGRGARRAEGQTYVQSDQGRETRRTHRTRDVRTAADARSPLRSRAPALHPRALTARTRERARA